MIKLGQPIYKQVLYSRGWETADVCASCDIFEFWVDQDGIKVDPAALHAAVEGDTQVNAHAVFGGHTLFSSHSQFEEYTQFVASLLNPKPTTRSQWPHVGSFHALEGQTHHLHRRAPILSSIHAFGGWVPSDDGRATPTFRIRGPQGHPSSLTDGGFENGCHGGYHPLVQFTPVSLSIEVGMVRCRAVGLGVHPSFFPGFSGLVLDNSVGSCSEWLVVVGKRKRETEWKG